MVATFNSVFQSATGVRTGHEEQAEGCDGLRGDQQREGLLFEDAGQNELVNAIAESMGLLRRETAPLESD